MSRNGYSSRTFLSQRRGVRYAPLAIAIALGFAASSQANTIVVDSADAVGGTGKCTLTDAVVALNTTTQTNGCGAGDGINDTIDLTGLPPSTTISLTQPATGTGYALALSGSGKATFIGTLASDGTPFVTIERSIVSTTPQFGLIQSNNPLYLSNLTLTNGASGTYVGGAVVAGGMLTVSNCVISNSKSDSAGGAIAVSGALMITHSIITGNTAGNAGGGIEAGSSAGIYDSTVSNNTTTGTGVNANGGGGIFASSALHMHNTTFSGNTSAKGGGAIYGTGIVNLDSSTISNNTAQSGPGGGVKGGAVDVTNSTVTGNAATGTGGGIDADTLGATYSTIAQNTSTGAGGGVNFASGADAQGTIFFGNTPDDLATPSSALMIGNYNIVGVTVAATVGDYVSCDPLLSPLADNGGPTKTMALQATPGLCAIDAASNPPADINDQRGFARPAVVGTNADIGAYEFGATDPDRIFADGFGG